MGINKSLIHCLIETVLILRSGEVYSKPSLWGRENFYDRFNYFLTKWGSIKTCIVGKMPVLILHSGEVLCKLSLWGSIKTCIVGKIPLLILHSGEVLCKPSLWGRENIL